MPYDIPGQMKKKDSPLDILQKRFASRQINKDEYQEQKKILANDLAKRRMQNDSEFNLGNWL